jgi:hypothetical protein
MGFNKRYISSEHTINALNNKSLKDYYGKSDALIFMDPLSSEVYNLHREGKKEEEILLIINKNMEEKTNEVY